MKDITINYKDLMDSLQPDKVISFEEKKRMIIEKYKPKKHIKDLSIIDKYKPKKLGKNPEILRMMKNV